MCNNNIPCDNDHLIRYNFFYKSHRLHSQHSFIHPPLNKNCLKYALYPRSIPEWNLLPDGIQMAPDLLNFNLALNTVDVKELVSRAHLKIQFFAAVTCTHPMYSDSPFGALFTLRSRSRHTFANCTMAFSARESSTSSSFTSPSNDRYANPSAAHFFRSWSFFAFFKNLRKKS